MQYSNTIFRALSLYVDLHYLLLSYYGWVFSMQWIITASNSLHLLLGPIEFQINL